MVDATAVTLLEGLPKKATLGAAPPSHLLPAFMVLGGSSGWTQRKKDSEDLFLGLAGASISSRSHIHTKPIMSVSNRHLWEICLIQAILIIPFVAPFAGVEPTAVIQKTWGRSGGDVGQGIDPYSSGDYYVMAISAWGFENDWFVSVHDSSGSRVWRVSGMEMESSWFVSGFRITFVNSVLSVSPTPRSPGNVNFRTEVTFAGLLVSSESKLYDPLRRWIKSKLDNAGEQGKGWVKVTASASGRKRKSGRWSRSDITSVVIRRYELIPSTLFEVSTFEVKRHGNAGNPSSVYQAAYTGMGAHFRILVMEDDKSRPLKLEPRFEKLLFDFGVGLWRMYPMGRDCEVEEEVRPERQIPSNEELDRLLQEFFANDREGLREFRASIGK